MQKIFDEKLLKIRRDLIGLNKNNQNHFLLYHIYNNVKETFKSFNKKFNKILLIGAISNEFTDFMAKKAQSKFVICDISQNLLHQYDIKNKILIKNEQLVANEKFDLIYSFLDLHHINNIPEYLISIKSHLNKNGFFMANFFGEENLKIIRKAILQASINKASPHLHPNIDIKTAGALLQKTGFKDVIADLDKLEIEYEDFKTFAKDLKTMNENNILLARNQNIVAKDCFKLTETILLDWGFIVEFDIINLIAIN